MPLKVDPAARAEAEEAALWYEQRETGPAWKFFSVYTAALEAIERNPESFPMLEALNSPEIRYCLLRPYAYRIASRVREDEILVFGVGHVRRDSAYWSRQQARFGEPPRGRSE